MKKWLCIVFLALLLPANAWAGGKVAEGYLLLNNTGAKSIPISASSLTAHSRYQLLLTFQFTAAATDEAYLYFGTTPLASGVGHTFTSTGMTGLVVEGIENITDILLISNVAHVAGTSGVTAVYSVMKWE